MRDIESVQRRPGMYIGNTSDGAGLHNMLYAPLDNAVAEVRCGQATEAAVDLYPDGACTVTDNGRGIPIVVPAEPTKPLIPRSR